MALTDEERQKFLAHLEEKQRGRSAACPVCGANKWSLEGPVVMIPTTEGGGIRLGGPAIPVMMLACMNCWFMRSFAWKPIADAP